MFWYRHFDSLDHVRQPPESGMQLKETFRLRHPDGAPDVSEYTSIYEGECIPHPFMPIDSLRVVAKLTPYYGEPVERVFCGPPSIMLLTYKTINGNLHGPIHQGSILQLVQAITAPPILDLDFTVDDGVFRSGSVMPECMLITGETLLAYNMGNPFQFDFDPARNQLTVFDLFSTDRVVSGARLDSI